MKPILPNLYISETFDLLIKKYSDFLEDKTEEFFKKNKSKVNDFKDFIFRT